MEALSRPEPGLFRFRIFLLLLLLLFVLLIGFFPSFLSNNARNKGQFLHLPLEIAEKRGNTDLKLLHVQPAHKRFLERKNAQEAKPPS